MLILLMKVEIQFSAHKTLCDLHPLVVQMVLVQFKYTTLHIHEASREKKNQRANACVYICNYHGITVTAEQNSAEGLMSVLRVPGACFR